MDTSQNPPGVSCLVHSGHVAKHESSFLYDIREGRLFRHMPHLAVGNAVVPAYIKDPPQAPLIQCINLSGVDLERAQHSDPYSIIGKMQMLYSFSLVPRESRDFQMYICGSD